jgi:hypothetical protein
MTRALVGVERNTKSVVVDDRQQKGLFKRVHFFKILAINCWKIQYFGDTAPSESPKWMIQCSLIAENWSDKGSIMEEKLKIYKCYRQAETTFTVRENDYLK